MGGVTKRLDHIMVGHPLKDLCFDSDIKHVSSVWTDRALLTTKLRLPINNTGKGLWRTRTKPAHVFLEHNCFPESLTFKARANSYSSAPLPTISTAVCINTIQFVSLLPAIFLVNPVGPKPLLVNGGGVDLSPHYCHKLLHQDIIAPLMSNT
ncbi:hypothetical protein MAM1_0313c09562 [Mucor ambiguus]|uniref:Uncharacterized protein n=1 Tax=Mucor ambiguus TaxID=91626 RepID=A0A0C9N613_9FUNG|nr:hypothetical protein MAM1_0313c09562 [Mucor ambiguus]